MARPMQAVTPLLLFWLFECTAASFASPHARSSVAPTLVPQRASPLRACEEHHAFEDSEDFGGDETDELDAAWRNFRAESIAERRGWWQALRREARLSVSPRERLEEAGGMLVAIAVFLLFLKAYIESAGGGIVLVPDEATGLLHLYNFNELRHLSDAELEKLHMPAVRPPMPMPSPFLLFEKELSDSLLRLLLGDSGGAHPPA